ncbi:EF-hand domain-containing protein [Novosphingobium humi]|uniref:EF-hand domain-containing protein n=1 Tax=Novosphingobium humi TaxID=2282397 RepID=A0ABY7TVD2_9SPHN|nr:hypothetical protein [Novosphingobium humi]WCT77193.1 hypothetical protein PQ457_14940 [Novosphingobium humi]
MRKLSIGLSAMALMAVSVAHAQAPAAAPATPPAGPHAMRPDMPPRAMPPMKDMTRAEAKAHAEKMFDMMDINHDGKLDKADREAREAKHFDAMDTNHDGQLSRQEFEAAHDRMREGMKHRMGAMGGDHDMPPPPPGGPEGAMDRGGMGPGNMGPGGPGMKGPRGHHRMGRGMMMGLMRQADPNHTGTVTKDAFVGAALKMFDSADANHDGKVTPEERRAAMKAHMGPNMGGRRGQGGMGQGGMGPGGMRQHGGHDMPPPAGQ